MEIPKIKSKSKNMTAHYAIKMTPEMKNRIDEIKTFKGIDMPELIRLMVSELITGIDQGYTKGQITWK